jgi:hypothetical protein
MLQITPVTNRFQTREEWLQFLIEAARPMFMEAGQPLPLVRAALCPPQKKPGKTMTLGLCWHSLCTDDLASREVWVSSVLKDPLRIAGTLVHELCHAALPDGVGHKRPFQRLATALGLHGPWRSTGETAEFAKRWEPILEAAGPCPTATFMAVRPIGARIQKTPKMRNVSCPACGFVAKVRCDQMHIGRLRCPGDDEELLTVDEREG